MAVTPSRRRTRVTPPSVAPPLAPLQPAPTVCPLLRYPDPTCSANSPSHLPNDEHCHASPVRHARLPRLASPRRSEPCALLGAALSKALHVAVLTSRPGLPCRDTNTHVARTPPRPAAIPGTGGARAAGAATCVRDLAAVKSRDRTQDQSRLVLHDDATFCNRCMRSPVFERGSLLQLVQSRYEIGGAAGFWSPRLIGRAVSCVPRIGGSSPQIGKRHVGKRRQGHNARQPVVDDCCGVAG